MPKKQYQIFNRQIDMSVFRQELGTFMNGEPLYTPVVAADEQADLLLNMNPHPLNFELELEDSQTYADNTTNFRRMLN